MELKKGDRGFGFSLVAAPTSIPDVSNYILVENSLRITLLLVCDRKVQLINKKLLVFMPFTCFNNFQHFCLKSVLFGNLQKAIQDDDVENFLRIFLIQCKQFMY